MVSLQIVFNDSTTTITLMSIHIVNVILLLIVPHVKDQVSAQGNVAMHIGLNIWTQIFTVLCFYKLVDLFS